MELKSRPMEKRCWSTDAGDPEIGGETLLDWDP